jgi:sugar/nucleoside kinase (ribokinase family)
VPARDNWDGSRDEAGRLDVVCLGNALVDVLAHTTDDELATLDLVKGSMALVDEDLSDRIYEQMRGSVEVSGGSAGNTTAGVAALGGKAGYIGKVAGDEFGEIFVHDMSVLGVELGARIAPSRNVSALKLASDDEGGSGAKAGATGRSLVLVTPDGERTMATHLGVASTLGPDDIDRDLVSRAEVVYVEGYLWDMGPAKEAVRLAMSIAHSADGLVALTLSDSFCVERHRQELMDLLNGDVDLLFCNEEEAKLLFGSPDLAHAVGALEETGLLAAVTCGAAGSVVVMADGPVEVPAQPVEQVVDTTGAGDLYAAGFIYGLTHGQDPVSAARLASACAAEVISHVGARPQSDIAQLVNAPRLRLL